MPQGRFQTNYDHETWQDQVDTALSAPVDTAKLADGAATLAKLDRTGATGRVLTAQGSGNAPVWGSSVNLGTAANSTSGTSIDFTGIPAGVNRVTVIMSGVSTNGTAEVILQIGDSGGIETTGYAGGYAFVAGTASALNYTDAFNIGGSLATNVRHGVYILSRLTGNLWACFGGMGQSDAGVASFTMASKTLSDTLDRVRITTRGGTNTFDAGQINVSWEF